MIFTREQKKCNTIIYKLDGKTETHNSNNSEQPIVECALN